MKPDWEAIRRERLAEQAGLEAFPWPEEVTAEACIAALRAEGCPEPTVNGTDTTFEAAASTGKMTFVDLLSLLRDWRYLKSQGKP